MDVVHAEAVMERMGVDDDAERCIDDPAIALSRYRAEA